MCASVLDILHSHSGLDLGSEKLTYVDFVSVSEDDDGPAAHVVAYNSMYGAASHPFHRSTKNVPTIPISIEKACAVSSASVRRCMRQRLILGFQQQVARSTAD